MHSTLCSLALVRVLTNCQSNCTGTGKYCNTQNDSCSNCCQKMILADTANKITNWTVHTVKVGFGAALAYK